MNRYTIEIEIVADHDPRLTVMDMLDGSGYEVFSATLKNVEPLELDGE